VVAAKVDMRAVQAELGRIAALMTEITRQMSPQTWQGGSAANFTIDLQGHNRSLTQMMTRVLEAAAASGQAPGHRSAAHPAGEAAAFRRSVEPGRVGLGERPAAVRGGPLRRAAGPRLDRWR
jgi:hypothetical protein